MVVYIPIPYNMDRTTKGFHSPSKKESKSQIMRAMKSFKSPLLDFKDYLCLWLCLVWFVNSILGYIIYRHHPYGTINECDVHGW